MSMPINSAERSCSNPLSRPHTGRVPAVAATAVAATCGALPGIFLDFQRRLREPSRGVGPTTLPTEATDPDSLLIVR